MRLDEKVSIYGTWNKENLSASATEQIANVYRCEHFEDSRFEGQMLAGISAFLPGCI